MYISLIYYYKLCLDEYVLEIHLNFHHVSRSGQDFLLAQQIFLLAHKNYQSKQNCAGVKTECQVLKLGVSRDNVNVNRTYPTTAPLIYLIQVQIYQYILLLSAKTATYLALVKVTNSMNKPLVQHQCTCPPPQNGILIVSITYYIVIYSYCGSILQLIHLEFMALEINLQNFTILWLF